MQFSKSQTPKTAVNYKKLFFTAAFAATHPPLGKHMGFYIIYTLLFLARINTSALTAINTG